MQFKGELKSIKKKAVKIKQTQIPELVYWMFYLDHIVPSQPVIDYLQPMKFMTTEKGLASNSSNTEH